MRPEEWTRQWQEYFDALDKVMDTMEKASNDLSTLSVKLGKWLDVDRYRIIAEIYSQNPLLAAMMKGATDDPFTRSVGNGMGKPLPESVKVREGEVTPRDEKLALSILELEWYGGPISTPHVTRFLNELQRQGIKTVGDLIDHTQWDLLHMPWIAKKVLAHIVNTLERVNLELKER